MPQCEDAIEVATDSSREIESSPLIVGLRQLMSHADNLRTQEERAAAARQAFGNALAQVREAVEIFADPEAISVLMETLRATAHACIDEGRRLHEHGASVHGIVAGLNQRLGELLGQRVE